MAGWLRQGTARHGRLGMVRTGTARHGRLGMVGPVQVWQVWDGIARTGWHGRLGLGTERRSEARHGRHGLARLVMAGEVSQGRGGLAPQARNGRQVMYR